MEGKMNIPDKVKICGYEYAVEFKETVTLDAKECFGTHSFNNLKISLSDQFPQQIQDATFLHEVIHAIDYTHSIGLKEEVVAKLANGLYAFIKDNPEVFKV
jgi:hypothetical protein